VGLDTPFTVGVTVGLEEGFKVGEYMVEEGFILGIELGRNCIGEGFEVSTVSSINLGEDFICLVLYLRSLFLIINSSVGFKVRSLEGASVKSEVGFNVLIT